MTDLISRQAVENITWEEPSYSDPLNVLTEVREKVRALPSVENKGEWIDDGFYAEGHSQHEYRCSECDDCDMAISALSENKGEWIKIQSGDKDFPESIVCSKCKNENSHLDFNEHGEPIGKVFVTSKFCPNCGADMRGKAE